MSDSKQIWTVKRKPSAYRDWRIVYEGSEEVARRRYDKIAENIRQGEVRLIDPDGIPVERDGGPMVRTRW